MALNIGREVAILKDMTVGQLRDKYREVFGEPTGVGNKDFLFKRIAWRLQSLAEGDLSQRARQRAAEIARDADVTQWNYDAETGLLTSKVYGYGSGTTDEIAYTYTPDGKMLQRTGGRGLTTAYHYYGDGSGPAGEPNTGDLRLVDYSDTTPDVGFTYDRLGRQVDVTDAVGTRTFAYRNDSDLQLASESINPTGGGLYSKLITRKYEVAGVPGRGVGFMVGSVNDPDADYEVTYGYDANTGVLNSIAGPGLPSSGVTYERLASSDLIWKVKYMDGQTVAAEIDKTYETHRDVLRKVENKRGGGVLVSSYDYTMDVNNHGADNVGRRTKVVFGGAAFNYGTPTPPGRTQWGYNDRNELTTSNSYTGGGSNMWDRYRSYGYDPIGNRSVDGRATADTLRYYCRNSLNQYVTRDDATSCPPPTPLESFVHDDDGNMTQDATLTYVWDAENRLASVAPTTPVSGSKKLEYVYDYQGRRVQKKVYTRGGGGGGTWSLTSTERFVYDGWNVVLTLNGAGGMNNAVTRKFTWGRDLSGALQGAGGIGGLLAGTSSGTPYWCVCDGNGNVAETINTSSVLSHTEYDPYGNVIFAFAAIGTPSNPFRFSTKWCDNELGTGNELYYYGYRYYIPRLGRWLSRDPIQERGGRNLYAFVRNAPIAYVDTNGLWPFPPRFSKEWRKRCNERYAYPPEGKSTPACGKLTVPQDCPEIYARSATWAQITASRMGRALYCYADLVDGTPEQKDDYWGHVQQAFDAARALMGCLSKASQCRCPPSPPCPSLPEQGLQPSLGPEVGVGIGGVIIVGGGQAGTGVGVGAGSGGVLGSIGGAAVNCLSKAAGFIMFFPNLLIDDTFPQERHPNDQYD